MYCPKCDRTIPDDRIAAIDKELRERFGVKELGEGRCPVCKTQLIDLRAAPGGSPGKSF